MTENAGFDGNRAGLPGIEQGWFEPTLDYTADDQYLTAP